MDEIELKLDDNNRGAFVIENGGERSAEMVFGVTGNQLTVFHTEVADEHKGKGVAAQLLSRMVAYARERKLTVMPRCSYVHAQFKRHPEQYADIWNQTL